MSLKKSMTKDHFAQKASSYEHNKDRVDNVANIADAIAARVSLNKSMQLMDFGSGTGLLLERIAPHVGKITAVDVSQSMNAQLRAKQDRIACPVEILEMDLAATPLNRKFDGIISSMTMHHIKDVPAMFAKFHSLLNEGGFIAIADLDLEDNSFHTEDTGVHHAGFKNVEVVTASVIRKHERDYPVFLVIAFK
jgi:cyclopropane fatty-acyl-phospholipid synthase-like methyltransferase